MITKSLAAFASPIITKAMETGGRSQTTTTTDYSGIGDAMMKKAQLEMQAASLKADVSLKTNAMNTDAKLKMIDIEDARMQQQFADREASKDMGAMEKGMGVIQGMMSGAQTGAAASGGNPYAMAAGAVIGGGAAAHDAYSGQPGDVKRAKMNNTNQTLGSIATIATTTRNMYDKYKGQEAYKSGVEDLGKIQQQIGGLTGAEREAKIQEYQQKSSAMQGEMGKYLGPAEATAAMEGIRKGQSAMLSNDPVVRAKAELGQLGVQMAADGELAEGSPTRLAKLKEYHGKANFLNGQLHGFDNKKQMGGQEFLQMAQGARPDLANVAFGAGGGINSMGGGGNVGAAPGVRGNPNRQIDPTTGAPIAQQNPNQNPGISVPGIAGGSFQVPATRGAVMDDGGPVAKGEQDLAMQGAQAVKVLDKDGTFAGEKSTSVDHSGCDHENGVCKYAENDMRNVFNGEDKGLESNSPEVRKGAAKIAGSREQTGRGGASGSWDDTPQEEKATGKGSLLEQRIEKIRNSPLNKGLNEDRIRDIAEYELQKEGHTNIDAREDDPKLAQKLTMQRNKSAQMDAEIEREFETMMPTLIDKSDKDGAKNILITKDNLNKQQSLIDRLPANDQVKAKAAEFLLNGMAENKDKEGLLGSMFLVKGNVATAVGAGILDKAISSVKGGMGKGSAKAVSAILTPDEIEAVEEYAQNEAMAIQALVKTGDEGVVNDGEVKHARTIFFNNGMTKDRKQERINGMKENMYSKMKAMRRTSQPFYKATQKMQTDVIQYRGKDHASHVYEEQLYREDAKGDYKQQFPEQEDVSDLNGQGGFYYLGE
jgi:hypothetical protein